MLSKAQLRFAFTALAITLCAVGAQAQVINEFVRNHTGTDTNEFVEIFGAPNTDYSNLWIVEIEGDSPATGLIDDGTIQLGTTDANGYWFTGYQDNVTENGTVTLLLVMGFTGVVGDDLDTDDDGVLDVTPWIAIIDDIAVPDGDMDDLSYASVTLDPGFDGDTFDVGGASRIPNGTDTNSVSDWTRNDFDGEGLPGFIGTPEDGEALNTAEAMNELAMGGGGPTLTITGSCPGDINIALTDATASATVGLLLGQGAGSDPIPGGPCVGVESGLMNLSLLTLLVTDVDGGFSLDRTVPGGACGAPLQVIDTSSCMVSNVANVP